MKGFKSYTVQVVLLIIIAVLITLPLACVATLTAPLHSPGYASRILCPPGSQPRVEWYRAPRDKPGQRTLSVTCVDSQGNLVPPNPQNEATLIKGIKLYFPVCFAPVIVLGIVVLLVANGLIRVIRSKTGRQSKI